MEIYVLKFTLISIMIIQSITNIKCENKTNIQKSPLNPLEHLLLHENTQDPQKQDESHIRVKRQFYYPYGYYRRPIPIIIGGIGVFGGGYGFGRPGFGSRGFGGRGFGGRGFGGRGFGGRGFGGRGFGGRGIGGIGGRGIGGFGGRGGRG